MYEINLENRVPLELLLIPESNSSLLRPRDRSLSNGEGDTDSGSSSQPGLLGEHLILGGVRPVFSLLVPEGWIPAFESSV